MFTIVSLFCLFFPFFVVVVSRYRLHRDELNVIHDSEERHRRLVELNVVEQCTNLFKVGAIQFRRQQTDPNNNNRVASGSSGSGSDTTTGGAEAVTQTEEEEVGGVGVLRPYATPRIHACVFDPKVGILHTLPVRLLASSARIWVWVVHAVTSLEVFWQIGYRLSFQTLLTHMLHCSLVSLRKIPSFTHPG